MEVLRLSGALAARASGALTAFAGRIEALAGQAAGRALAEQVDLVIHASGLLEYYGREKGERGQARVENLEELVTAARQFVPDLDDDAAVEPATAFLAYSALEAGEGQAAEWDDCVQLMTLHSAKGLEFPLVFLCGLEEGLFPHNLSLHDPDRLEEERRLAYVGMTRAMRHLFLTYAERRRLHGNESVAPPSRFLAEIPPELIDEVRLRGTVTRPLAVASRSQPDAPFRLGQPVVHAKFGDGVVLGLEGDGANARVQVNFRDVGAKWLMLAYAKLQPL
jgi:DNA helicase-2/ATP-dependent DNA helicase PcrA